MTPTSDLRACSSNKKRQRLCKQFQRRQRCHRLERSQRPQRFHRLQQFQRRQRFHRLQQFQRRRGLHCLQDKRNVTAYINSRCTDVSIANRHTIGTVRSRVM
ncbi:hypothetical protein DPMN_087932 [Dreissena polymorpha]|uniref:Uncharacterized protein n=1 Tax=Dreissena polymorpha TaxID=45954 RepID=A0A9D4KTN6_DREPO|nr:hypothetical protein DPMN_087932 [Dreissena polymorpha]